MFARTWVETVIYLIQPTYNRVRANPPQERSQGEAPQLVLYSYLWRV